MQTRVHGAFPRLRRRRGFLLAVVALAATAPGQPPPARPISGLILTPAGDPLGFAEVSFHPGPRPGPSWLDGWLPPPATPGPRAGRSDAAGSFRLAGVAGELGCLLVRHRDGLGALATDLAPGAPQRIAAQPLGELLIRGEAPADVQVDVAAVLEFGMVHLGSWRGPELRLPPGAYRALLRRGVHWSEHHCRITSGARLELPAPPSGTAAHRVLRLPSAFAGTITLDGWPGLPLPLRQGMPALTLPDTTPVRLGIEEQPGAHTALGELWLPGTALEPVLDQQPPPTHSVRLVGPDGPVAGAWLLGLVDRPGGVLQPTSRSRSDARGDARHGDATRAPLLTAHAPGLAHCLVTASQLDGSAAEIRLQPGHAVVLQVTAATAAPVGATSEVEDVAGLRVELQHAAHPLLVFAGRTDRRGRLRFDDVPPGAARLVLRSERHLPDELDISVPANRVWQLPAHRGAAISGEARLPDGSPAAGAVVRARNAMLVGRGGAALAPRVVVADELGRFRFEGLPSGETFTVSAAVQHGTQTWSVQQRGVQPGDGSCLLQLALEDPAPPAPTGRPRGG